MNPSWRKPFGMLLILLVLAGWTVIVVSLVGRLDLPPLAQLPVYVVGGIAWLWLLPMRRLLRWMELGVWRD
jgi:hypothetical protein